MKKIRSGFWVISKWITSVFSLFIFFAAYSQPPKLPLQTVLDSLEKRHDVVFSYADENIVDRKVTFPTSNHTLRESLDLLSQETNLTFEDLNGRYYAIKKKESFRICGYLLDRETNEPIDLAIVNIENTGIYTISNTEGFFQLSCNNRSEKISISHLSYQPVKLLFETGEPCIRMTLAPKVAELQEVYVSNFLAQGVTKKVNGEIEVKTNKLQVLPGLSEPDVLYIMQVLPGIQSPLESVSDINIRGGTNDQNLIMWDKIRMFQSSHFYGLISAFNPYFTESVTLVKNGTSAELGEGVSGTLDIRSRDEIPTKLSGSAGINLLSSDVELDVPVSKKVSVSLAARRSIADLVETPTYTNYFDRAFRQTAVTSFYNQDSVRQSDVNFIFYDISGKMNLQPTKKDKIELSFIDIFNDLNYQEEGVYSGSNKSKTSSLTQQNTGIGLNYMRRWSDRIRTTFNSYVSSYKLGAVNNDVLNEQQLIQKNEVLDVGFAADMKIVLNNQFDLLTGIQYEETGVVNLEDLNNPDFRRRIKDVLTRQAIFSELSYFSPSEKTNIRVGFRMNNYNQTHQFIAEPRLVFRQKILPNTSLEIMSEFKNQTMAQIIDLQKDFLGVEKRRWVLANGEDIPVIQSKQASLGLHFHKNNLLISGESYYKIVNGIITSSQAFQNQFELIRTSGNYRIYGLDFIFNKQFEGLSVWLSYALAKNSYDYPQLPVTSFPNNLDVRHNITVGSSYKSEHFQFSVGVNWHSGRPFTPIDPENPVVDGNINYQLPNSSHLKEYLRIDLSGKYLFDLGEKANGQIGFSIWNLSNDENILRSYYRINEQGDFTRIEQKGLRFTPNSMFRINF